MNVTMQPTQLLMKSYHCTVRKENILTGSASVVKEDLERQTSNITQALQGLSTGVQLSTAWSTGASASILIRGIDP